MGEFVIATNKRAYHDYELLAQYEAGIVLTGNEIKAVRAKKVNLQGSFARVRYTRDVGEPELVVFNLHIGAGEIPTRTRKLLLHRGEIQKLIGKLQEKRLTLIPVRLYLKRGRAKLELGLGRGRKQYEKRERLKQKHRKRDLERELRAS
ncbi:SsrA-binding protein SmpB [Candidatus Berkelbacteria bacterium]|nr:SsrA-binding protein SmpB [Candidatus Berkelbacteria bacterium]